MITKEEEQYLHDLEVCGVRKQIISQLRQAFESGLSKNQVEEEKEDEERRTAELIKNTQKKKKKETGTKKKCSGNVIC